MGNTASMSRAISLCVVLCVTSIAASPIGGNEDTWVESPNLAVQTQQTKIFVDPTMHDAQTIQAEVSDHWSERNERDLIAVGWGNAQPKTKTLSMVVDAQAMGAKAAVCVQAEVPSWVPTSMMNKGMNLVWNTKIGKKIAAGMA